MTSASPARRVSHNAKYYAANKAKVMERNRANKKRNYDYVWSIKAVGLCVDCGENPHPATMQFDHISDDKFADVGNMVANGYSLARIQAEIDKCELVCANCHFIRTYNRRQASVV